MSMINAAPFAPVLAWLDAGAPHHQIGFNMLSLRNEDSTDYAGNECGTSCCIAGALVQFNPELFDVNNNGGFTPFIEIGETLGMDVKQVSALFFASDYEEPTDTFEGRAGDLLPDDIPFGKITPLLAARAVRHLLETGEVKWT